MGNPQVPIDVDPTTGVWTTDGLPMIYVPRHFFVNNHLAIETALGVEAYARQLYEAGFQSAYTWCEHEAQRHQLRDIDVFHHYMQRLSQRGWGQFRVQAIDADSGRAAVRVDHSVFVLQLGSDMERQICYMFTGWFPGALAWVCQTRGRFHTFAASEIQCGAEGHSHCLFEVHPADGVDAT